MAKGAWPLSPPGRFVADQSCQGNPRTERLGKPGATRLEQTRPARGGGGVVRSARAGGAAASWMALAINRDRGRAKGADETVETADGSGPGVESFHAVVPQARARGPETWLGNRGAALRVQDPARGCGCAGPLFKGRGTHQPEANGPREEGPRRTNGDGGVAPRVDQAAGHGLPAKMRRDEAASSQAKHSVAAPLSRQHQRQDRGAESWTGQIAETMCSSRDQFATRVRGPYAAIPAPFSYADVTRRTVGGPARGQGAWSSGFHEPPTRQAKGQGERNVRLSAEDGPSGAEVSGAADARASTANR